MNYELIKLLLPSFILFSLISCGDTDKSDNSNEPLSTEISTEQSTEENKVAAPGPFEVKSGIIHYQTKNIEGKIKAENKLYFENFGNLLKLEETINGETSIYVYNNDTKQGATLWTGKEKPIKSYSKQGEILTFCALRSTQGFTQLDDAILLGKNCSVYANNAKSENGESKLTYWRHKGIILKEINQLGMGYQFEATKFEAKPIKRDVFSLLDEI